MGRGHDHVGRALLEQGLGGVSDRGTGVDHVVHKNAGAPDDLPDDLEHLHLVGDIRIAPLVDDREWGAEPVSPPLADPDPAGVWRDDRHPAEIQLALQVRGQCGKREEVVDRTVEEALDLSGVQVNGHQPVRARRTEEVSHQPG